MDSESKSGYLLNLEKECQDVADRYKDKLRLINNVDPYCLCETQLCSDGEVFPVVTPYDTITYLVLTHSFYTNEQMKAYKSLNAYKYFDAGFVQRMAATKINEFIVVLGKVKHSQRMRAPPLQVWVLCHENGGVQTGHCTCMAGASEVCSHVGAILYALEYITHSRNSTSCTDVKAQWVIPSITDVPIAPLGEMDWNKKSKVSAKKTSARPSFPALEGNELVEFLEGVQSDSGSAVLMKHVEPFASAFANEDEESVPCIYDIYNKNCEKFSYDELLVVALGVNQNITVEQCADIMRATVEQSASDEWFNQRAGRITASKLKSVCRTSIVKPSMSLVKSICYPLKFVFKSKATEWGLNNESRAISDYAASQEQQHANFNVRKCGLCIRPDMPSFGASPDGLVTCDCCGDGCVEVKCPYLLRNMKIEDYLNLKNSCLTVDGENIILKRNHAYFYQVQLQMKVTNTPYCDFVVWSSNGYFLERIAFNEDFWACEYPKAKEFHDKVIMPELLARFFTKGKHMAQTWCICNTSDDGRPMLECGNDNCETQWFHFECLGISDIPDGLWICESCTTLVEQP